MNNIHELIAHLNNLPQEEEKLLVFEVFEEETGKFNKFVAFGLVENLIKSLISEELRIFLELCNYAEKELYGTKGHYSPKYYARNAQVKNVKISSDHKFPWPFFEPEENTAHLNILL